MSLDVWLTDSNETTEACECPRCWTKHEHTYRENLFSYNITHNLNRMAMEAGCYEAVWRPDENGISEAQQLIEPLRTAIERIERDPQRFMRLEPANGWGSYDGLLRFLKEYLKACTTYPAATVWVGR